MINFLQGLSVGNMVASVIFLLFVAGIASGLAWSYGGDTMWFKKTIFMLLVMTLCMAVAGLLSRGG